MATPRPRMHPNVACIYGGVQNVQNHGVAVRVSIKDLEQMKKSVKIELVSYLWRVTVLLSF